MNQIRVNAPKTSIRIETLIKLSALLLIIGGILYIVIQFIHPPDDISSINNNIWLVVALLSSIMSLFISIGLLASYLIQVEEIGALGLIGFIVFYLFWIISMIFGFIEAFILPLLTTEAVEFTLGMVGLFGDGVSNADLGIFPILATVSGIFYILGGLLFGIAGFRAKVLSKFAFLFLAFAALATIATGFVPHPQDRIFAIPMGIAMILIGVSVLRNRNIG